MWQHFDGRESIRACRYAAGAGWGTAETIETDTMNHATDPRVAVDASGNAMVVWKRAALPNVFWANRYTAGSGWGTAEPIDVDNTGDGFNPRVALHAGGDAIAVWEQDGDPTADVRLDIWANRYTPAAGWGTAARIETDDAGNASFADVAIDPDGNAIAVWNQSNGSRFDVWANRYE